MAMRGLVTWIGGAKPWITRLPGQTANQPFATCRAAQLPVEAMANTPLRWTKLVLADGTTQPPETWVADDLATGALVVGGLGPFALADGQHVDLIIDTPVVAPQVVTVSAQPATATAQVAGNYTIAAGSIAVNVSTPGGQFSYTVTVAIPPAPSDAATAAAWLNANALPPGATFVFGSEGTTNKLTIESVGTGSGFVVSVVTVSTDPFPASIGFTAANTVALSTGNVPDASNVTAADALNLLNGFLGYGAVPALDSTLHLTLSGTATGHSHTLQVANTSTANLGFDNAVHYGVGP